MSASITIKGQKITRLDLLTRVCDARNISYKQHTSYWRIPGKNNATVIALQGWGGGGVGINEQTGDIVLDVDYTRQADAKASFDRLLSDYNRELVVDDMTNQGFMLSGEVYNEATQQNVLTFTN